MFIPSRFFLQLFNKFFNFNFQDCTFCSFFFFFFDTRSHHCLYSLPCCCYFGWVWFLSLVGGTSLRGLVRLNWPFILSEGTKLWLEAARVPVNLAPGGLDGRGAGSFCVGEPPNTGCRRSFLISYLVFLKEESLPGRLDASFLRSGNSECRRAGKSGREGPTAWVWLDRPSWHAPSWAGGGRGRDHLALRRGCSTARQPPFLVCFVPPHLGVLGLLCCEVLSVQKGTPHRQARPWELGCSSPHGLIAVLSLPSILPQTCSRLAPAAMSSLLLFALWVYTFFPPIPMAGFRRK